MTEQDRIKYQKQGYKVLTAEGMTIGQCYINHDQTYVIMCTHGYESPKGVMILKAPEKNLYHVGSRYTPDCTPVKRGLWCECDLSGFHITPKPKDYYIPVTLTYNMTVKVKDAVCEEEAEDRLGPWAKHVQERLDSVMTSLAAVQSYNVKTEVNPK